MEPHDILPWLERGYAIGVRDKHVGDLLGISAGTLNRAKTGSGHLPAQDWLNVKNLILKLEELAEKSPLPINWSDLRAVRVQLQALDDERRNPAPPPSEDDLFLMMKISEGLMAAEIATLLKITQSELSVRLAEAIRRFKRLESSIEQFTRESRELRTLTRVEFEARKIQTNQR